MQYAKINNCKIQNSTKLPNQQVNYSNIKMQTYKSHILNPNIFTILTILYCLPLFQAFEFKYAQVTLDSQTIAITTAYQFTLQRQYTNTFVDTNWKNQLIPAGSTIRIMFPQEYSATNIAGFTCNYVMINFNPASGYLCSINGTEIIISGLFPTNSNKTDFIIQIGNILNPAPAISTSPFVAYVGNDYSANDTKAQVSFSPATLQNITCYFSNPTVNTTSNMIFNITLKNYIPVGGSIKIIFPSSLQWLRDVSTNHLFPIQGSLLCSPISVNVYPGLTCSGLQSIQTVTLNNIVSVTQNASTLIIFSINNMFSPPTTQSIDQLKIYTLDQNGFYIDTSVFTISGLIAKTLGSFSIGPTGDTSLFTVNYYLSGLIFSFTLQDTVTKADYFQIHFPSNTTLQYLTYSSLFKITNVTYNSTTRILYMNQTSSSQTQYSQTNLSILFVKYKAPPSIRPTNQIVFKIMNNGYQKMSGSGTVQALPNQYNFSLLSNTTLINAKTSLKLSFSLLDPLTANGMLLLNIPSTGYSLPTSASNINIALSSSLSTSFKIGGTPNFIYIFNFGDTINSISNSTFTTCNSSKCLLLKGLSSSGSQISAQNINLTISGLLNIDHVDTVSSLSFQTYYDSQLDSLVDKFSQSSNYVTSQGYITINNIFLTSSTTNTMCNMKMSITLQNQISVNGYLQILIPSKNIYLDLSLSINTISISAIINNNSYFSNQMVTISSNNTVSNSILLTYDNTNTTYFSLIFNFNSTSSIPSGANIDIIIHNILSLLKTGSSTGFIFSTFNSQRKMIDANAQANYTVSSTTPIQEPSSNIIFYSLNNSYIQTTSNISSTFLQNSAAQCLSNQQQCANLFKITHSFPFVEQTINGSTQMNYLKISYKNFTSPFGYDLSKVTKTYLGIQRIVLIETDLNQVLVYKNQLLNGGIQWVQCQFIIEQTTNQQIIIIAMPSISIIYQNISLTKTSYLRSLSLTSFSLISEIYINFFTISNPYSLKPSLINVDIFSSQSTIQLLNSSTTNSAISQYCFYQSYTKNEQASQLIIANYSFDSLIWGDTSSGLNLNLNLSNWKFQTSNSTQNQPVKYIYVVFGSDFFQNISILSSNLLCSTTSNLVLSCSVQQVTTLLEPNVQLNSILDISSFTVIITLIDLSKVQLLSTINLKLASFINPQQPISLNASIDNQNKSISLFSLSINQFLIHLNKNAIVFSSNCQYPCKQCLNSSSNTTIISTSCKNCFSGMLLYNQYCYKFCPVGTIQQKSISNQSICIDCSMQCQTCFANVTFCTKCNSSSQYKYLFTNTTTNESTCLTKCPSSYYIQKNNSNGNQICQQCEQNCTTCFNFQICLVCISSFFLYDDNCIQSCPIGTFSNITNSTNKICEDCKTNYNNCFYCNSSACLICDSLFYIYDNGVCVLQCQDSFYSGESVLLIQTGNFSYSTCKKCDSNCKTCINSSTLCLSCPNNQSISTFLYQDQCKSSCPIYTYPNFINNTCLNCSDLNINCKNCSSNSTCYTCDSSYLYFSLNQSCITQTQVPDGYLIINNTIYQCSQNCSSCAVSTENCTTCKAGYYYFSPQGIGYCLLQCPLSTYNFESKNFKQCLYCPYPCLSCKFNILLNSTQCLSCLTNSSLFYYNFQCVTTSQCPNNTFPSNTSQTCANCLDNCFLCQNDGTSCITCKTDFYLLNKSCLNQSQCPLGTVAIIQTNSSYQNFGNCVICFQSCSSCQITELNCTSCKSSFFYNNFTNQCLSNCSSPLIQDFLSMKCVSCQTPCHLCINTTSTCISCITNYFYLSQTNRCYSLNHCPNGFYSNTTTFYCEPCAQNCSICSFYSTNALSCTSCVNPSVLYAGSCLDSCPTNAPINKSGICYTCSSLISGCFNCSMAVATVQTQSSSLICNNCNDPYILLNSICYLNCPSGYVFQASTNQCITQNQNANDNLNSSLSTNTIFPMPFTIIGTVIIIACIMSKLQNDNSYFVGTVYSFLGVLQTCSIAYLIVRLMMYSHNGVQNWSSLFLLFQIVIGWIFLTNILGLLIQTPLLSKDPKFTKWLQNHSFGYVITIILSVTTSYKFKMMLFSRLFSFNCFRAQLEDIQKFRIFNMLSFIGVGHQGLFLYATALILTKFSFQDEIFLVIIDVAIISCMNLILAMAVAKKQQTFFQESEDGITLNKKVQVKSEQQKSHLKVFNEYMNGKTGGMESLNKLVEDILQDQEFSLSMSRDSNQGDKNSDEDKSAQKLKINKNNKSCMVQNENKQQSQGLKNQQKKLKSSALYEYEMSPQKMLQHNKDHPTTIFQQHSSRQKDKSQTQSQNNKKVSNKKNVFQQMDHTQQKQIIELGDELNDNEVIDNHNLRQEKKQKVNKQQEEKQKNNKIENEESKISEQNQKIQNIIFEEQSPKKIINFQSPNQQETNNLLIDQKNIQNEKNQEVDPKLSKENAKTVKIYRGRNRIKDTQADDQQISSALKNKKHQLQLLKKSRQKLQVKRSRSKSISKSNNKKTIQKSVKNNQNAKSNQNQTKKQQEKLKSQINNENQIDFTQSLIEKQQNTSLLNKNSKTEERGSVEVQVKRRQGNFFDNQQIQQVSMIKNMSLNKSKIQQKQKQNRSNLKIDEQIQQSKLIDQRNNLITNNESRLVNPIQLISDEDSHNFQSKNNDKQDSNLEKNRGIQQNLDKFQQKQNRQFYLSNSEIDDLDDVPLSSNQGQLRQNQGQLRNQHYLKIQSVIKQQKIEKNKEDVNLQEYKDIFKKRLTNNRSSSKKNLSEDQDQNIKSKEKQRKNNKQDKNFVKTQLKGRTQPFKIKDILDINQKQSNLPSKSKYNYPLSTSRQKYQLQNTNQENQSDQDQPQLGNKTFDIGKRRPPRPISSQKTQKSRMYMAGVTGIKNLQYEKSSTSNISSSANQISPNKMKSNNFQPSTKDKRNMTAYDIPFSQMKSNQISNFSSENQSSQVDLLMMETNNVNFNYQKEVRNNDFNINKPQYSSTKLNQEREKNNQIPRKPRIMNTSNEQLQKQVSKLNLSKGKNYGQQMKISRNKRSISRNNQHLQQQSQTRRRTPRRSRNQVEQIDVDDLDQYYKRNTRRQDLNKSKSKERPMSRQSSKKLKSLQKIYLQRLDHRK